MHIVSFQDRYLALSNGLDLKNMATDQLTVQKKASFCKKVIKLFIRMFSFGMMDPYRHVRVGRVASAIFEDCKKNIAELQDPNNVTLVLTVLEKLKLKNPKKFASVCELYSYAVIGMGKPEAPKADKENKPSDSSHLKQAPAPGKIPSAPPPPPVPKASPKLVLPRSPKKPADEKGLASPATPTTDPKELQKDIAAQVARGRAKLRKVNTDSDLNRTVSSPSAQESPNLAAAARAALRKGKK